MERPKRVYAKLPKSLIGKDSLDNLTPEEQADFDAFVDEFVTRLAEAAGRDPKTFKKVRRPNS